jgi:hypothetical protein
MEATKIQVKVFIAEGPFELEPFIPVLHEWIKTKALDELLIDVADYGHVHHGPGLLLVGDLSDYYLDLGEGRPGLLYSRKRGGPSDRDECVVDALRRALIACQKLEAAPVEKSVAFRGDELLIRVNDRLRFPNDDATFAALEPFLGRALKKLYGGVATSTQREGTERDLFTVRVRAPGAPPASELLQRLV